MASSSYIHTVEIKKNTIQASSIYYLNRVGFHTRRTKSTPTPIQKKKKKKLRVRRENIQHSDGVCPKFANCGTRNSITCVGR